MLRRIFQHVRAPGRTDQRLFATQVATLVIIGLNLAAPASASLIGTYSLRFDAQVKSGANTGEEGHFNNPIPYINPVTPPHELPANVDPGGRLRFAIDLRVTETEAAGAVTFSLNSKNTIDPIFANPLDPALPVEWESFFSWTNVPSLQKIAVTAVKFEHGSTILAPLTTYTASGLGTVANPLHLSVQIDPSLFDPTPNNQIFGPVKLRFEYMTMSVPEPSTAAIGIVGMVGVFGLWRRKHR